MAEGTQLAIVLCVATDLPFIPALPSPLQLRISGHRGTLGIIEDYDRAIEFSR